MKAQRVCRVKAIPVAARATRISALWLGVAALTLAVAACGQVGMNRHDAQRLIGSTPHRLLERGLHVPALPALVA